MDFSIIPADDSGEDILSLIDVEKKIRDEVTELQNEKQKRMKAYEEAREAEEAACEVTGSNPCYIVIDGMPTDDQVCQIKNHVIDLHVRFKRDFLSQLLELMQISALFALIKGLEKNFFLFLWFFV